MINLLKIKILFKVTRGFRLQMRIRGPRGHPLTRDVLCAGLLCLGGWGVTHFVCALCVRILTVGGVGVGGVGGVPQGGVGAL